MFSSPTIYRSGSRTVEVLPGESHSAAWAYIVAGGPEPRDYPCVRPAGGGRVRRRRHVSRRRQDHDRRARLVIG
jgi:hypothetical protein